ncbi:hypothetical protein, partial [Burkholderia cepacia]|uniref:hypothetical protein n=1 Tax=Burkholderia cepacia TaxID=292 RepID=UPI002ABDF27C
GIDDNLQRSRRCRGSFGCPVGTERLQSDNRVVALTVAQADGWLHDTAVDIDRRRTLDHDFPLCRCRQLPGERRDAQNSIKGMLHFHPHIGSHESHRSPPSITA